MWRLSLPASFAVVFLAITNASAQYDLIPAPQNITVAAETSRCLDVRGRKEAPSLPPEGYELDIAPEGVSIRYGGKAGLDYAHVTLEQLKDQLKANPQGIPAGVIADHPAYPWRGMMVDVARHYMPLDDLKQWVDVMHFYKFNKLHLHLTDNQGWRLPVPGYPKLRSVASKRRETMGNGKPHGGMYTPGELKELVAYCARRHIEVIPEIDVPGHNQALAAAYPELFCPPIPNVEVATAPGNSKLLVCPSRRETLSFYSAVFDAIKEIFPSPYVHLGGDEAPTDRWKVCPLCQKQRSRLHLKNTDEQMGAFFATMTDMLDKRGKRAQFWFENDASIYRKGQTVYSWRMGLTPATIDKTRAAGLKLILTPGEHCYLDYPQMKEHSNRGWMRTTTLEQSYSLQPSYGRPAAEVEHILGVHCTLWAESLPTLEHVLYRAYPRAMAIAEAGWTQPERRSWSDFQKRLEAHKKSFPARFKYSLERTPTNEPPLNR